VAFTYFFRDRQTLELIASEVLPALRGYRYLRIWDAGCAHGPEPYSLAILLRENMSHFLFRNVRIHATDVEASGAFARNVAEGVFPQEELQRVPPDLKRKYFRPGDAPGLWRVRDDIRQSISFARHDLLSLKPPRTGFRLIVCKNVLLHFTPLQRVRVVRMFHDALADGGFFVTEQTQSLPGPAVDWFERVTCKGQVFRKLPAAPQRQAA